MLFVQRKPSLKSWEKVFGTSHILSVSHVVAPSYASTRLETVGKVAHITCLLAVVKTCGQVSKYFVFSQTTLFSAEG